MPRRSVARALGAVEHRVVHLDLGVFGGSALTDPASRAHRSGAGIPVTYVPARNTIFLALALAHAEVTRADAIFTGERGGLLGLSRLPPEFLAAFEQLANLATKRAVEGAPIRIERRSSHDQGRDRAPRPRARRRLLAHGVVLQRRREGAPAGMRRVPLPPRGLRAAGLADPTRYRG
jgi:7-cyano-7-deazaguanine synthase